MRPRTSVLPKHKHLKPIDIPSTDEFPVLQPAASVQSIPPRLDQDPTLVPAPLWVADGDRTADHPKVKPPSCILTSSAHHKLLKSLWQFSSPRLRDDLPSGLLSSSFTPAGALFSPIKAKIENFFNTVTHPFSSLSSPRNSRSCWTRSHPQSKNW